MLNPLWAWIVSAEQPGPWAIAGGAVILTASALTSLQDGGRPDASG